MTINELDLLEKAVRLGHVYSQNGLTANEAVKAMFEILKKAYSTTKNPLDTTKSKE